MPSFDETLNVDTPENVTFGFQVAGIGSRFLAALVDTILITILQFIGNWAIIALFFRGDGEGGFSDFANQHLAWLLIALGLVTFFFLWGYYIFFEMIWNGQTPGKRWARLRVIRTDGTPITLPESLVRNLVRIVDFLPAYYGVGVVSMFVNDQSRRLGDLAAGTLVVREDRKAVTLQSLEAAPGIRKAAVVSNPLLANLPDGLVMENLPLEKLAESDYILIEEFLGRQKDLANRDQLARMMLERLWAKMGLPSDGLYSYRSWSLQILEAIAGQRR